jgi:CPA2 family monovalent cation:H+ antiporter-2
MLLDPYVTFTRYEIIFTFVTIILVVKVVTGTFAATVLGMPVRMAVFTGLAQIKEFSFVLAKSGLGTTLLDKGPYQTFLASAIITMAP